MKLTSKQIKAIIAILRAIFEFFINLKKEGRDNGNVTPDPKKKGGKNHE